ncbi:hypothetical protein [Motilibacter deserti]|uniref:Uncharacterized protein n=1 Tax=Motilibacter deserti TaxID=2714956 RepID=A0ABX0GT03_9ACTN|nr:hypothetical protein [Motilibacter deserti]NHC13643.1 hypothetical protein [Motilibacter deserti]
MVGTLVAVLLGLAIPAGVAAVIYPRGDAPQRLKLADEKARQVDLALTPDVADDVAERLLRRKRASLLGGLLGFAGVLPLLVTLADRAWAGLVVAWAAPAAGRAVALAVVAAREAVRAPDAEAPRLARAVRPSTRDYVPTSALACAGAAALVGPAVALASLATGWGDPWPVVGRTGMVLAIALPPAVLALTLLLWRRWLDMPQPAATVQQLAWDDALRAGLLQDSLELPVMCSVLVVLPPLFADERFSAAFPFVLLVLIGLAVAFTVRQKQGSREPHFRHRLWPPLQDAVR